MPPERKFRNPMDAESIRRRITYPATDEGYDLAVAAAGYQSASTVDPLAWAIRRELPEFIARLASEVEESLDVD